MWIIKHLKKHELSLTQFLWKYKLIDHLTKLYNNIIDFHISFRMSYYYLLTWLSSLVQLLCVTFSIGIQIFKFYATVHSKTQFYGTWDGTVTETGLKWDWSGTEMELKWGMTWESGHENCFCPILDLQSPTFRPSPVPL